MAYIGPAPANSIIATSDIEDGAVTSAKLAGNIVTPGTLDVNGQELILDANANTSLTADTDDQVDIKVGGTDVVTLTNSSFVLKGTTPTLTIGDAGTEDTKIVFDGNAQDFHIGLDDTADDLVIGLGSALGTTTHMSFDETGAILKPLQPAFLAQVTSVMSNLALSTQHPVTMDNEIFDQNGDFNTTNYTFTAPVTGRYLLSTALRLDNMDTATTAYACTILASSREFTCGILDPDDFASDVTWMVFSGTFIVDMDASDTAKVQMYVDSGGTPQADIQSGTNATFSGCLLV